MAENKEFNEVNENAVEQNEKTTQDVEIVEVKKGPFAWFKGLKTWQKITVGGVTVIVLVVGGKKIMKVLKKNPEVVNTVQETAKELVEDPTTVETTN